MTSTALEKEKCISSGEAINRSDEILTQDAINFICMLEEKFGLRRKELLKKRIDIQSQISKAYIKSLKLFICRNRVKKLELICLHGQTIYHDSAKKNINSAV